MKNKKLIILVVIICILFFLVGCSKTMEQLDSETYSDSSYNQKIENIYNSQIADSDLNQNTKIIETVDSSLFYDENLNKSICTDDGILKIVSLINKTIGYNMLDGVNILNSKDFFNITGINTSVYDSLCAIKGNNTSNFDILFIAKINNENPNNIEGIYQSFVKYRAQLIEENSENDELVARLTAMPITRGNDYIFMFSLGTIGNTKTSLENIYNFYTSENNIVMNNIYYILNNVYSDTEIKDIEDLRSIK